MPITLYSGANLKKLKKDELRLHIVELYKFVELFSGESIVKLKEENERLKKENEFVKTKVIGLTKKCVELQEKMAKLKKSELYGYKMAEEEQEQHSHTLNNIRDTFNLSAHNVKQAEMHGNKFDNSDSPEGHYRKLIGDWYVMCIKHQFKEQVKENERLKEEKMKVINDAYKCHYDKWKEEQESIVKEEYEEVFLASEERIQELKEENEELNGCLEAATTERDKAFDDINKLKDATNQLNRENEKLKERMKN